MVTMQVRSIAMLQRRLRPCQNRVIGLAMQTHPEPVFLADDGTAGAHEPVSEFLLRF